MILIGGELTKNNSIIWGKTGGTIRKLYLNVINPFIIYSKIKLGGSRLKDRYLYNGS